MTEDGNIVTGANIENASYVGTICAERTAIVRCVMEGHRSFRAIAVASDQSEPVTPCGMCRQFIREFGREIEVIMVSGDESLTVRKTLDELLPMSFGPEILTKVK